jgi:hypothetical protein
MPFARNTATLTGDEADCPDALLREPFASR